MAKTLHEMAMKLQEYIIDQVNNSNNVTRANLQRYNNLKLKMEARDYPHIIIVIGISQATYNLDSLHRIEGGLGIDEKWIKRWLASSSVVGELKMVYASFEERLKEAKVAFDKKLAEEDKEEEGVAIDIDFKKIEKKNQMHKEREFYQSKRTSEDNNSNN